MFSIKKISVVLWILFLVGCSSEVQYDLLILNGTVYDGSLNDPVETDLGIVGDRIIQLGDLEKHKATQIVDARGLSVAPGFIDLHVHLEPIFSL